MSHRLKAEGGAYMPYRQPKLHCIRNNQPIQGDTHDSFLHLLQRALLLALQERGRLNDRELRLAEEKLNRQRQDRARRLLEGGEVP